ncbi:MAG: hypothetical protein AD742_21490 [Methylibium sp. NZG]|nr:MAG: hypothetical protein AD742_21490 [Methylibium sp. NZG]
MSVHPKRGVLLVLAAAAFWGTTGTAQSLAGPGLSALWFGTLRLVVATAFFALCSWAVARASHTGRGGAARLPLSGVLGAGLCMAVYNLAFFAGVRQVGVAVGTAVALGSGPLWAGVMQALLSRQAPAPAWWCGTALAVTGGALMTLPAGAGSPGAGAVTGATATGVALCLLSGLAYAGYTLVNKALVPQGSASAITLRAFGVAALLALPVAGFDAGVPSPTAAQWVAVLYVGVVTTGVAYLLFSLALRHVSAATGVTLALAEPVMAFALAITVIGEPTSAAALCGLLLVIGGVWVVVRAELRASPEAQRPAPAPAAAAHQAPP